MTLTLEIKENAVEKMMKVIESFGGDVSLLQIQEQSNLLYEFEKKGIEAGLAQERNGEIIATKDLLNELEA